MPQTILNRSLSCLFFVISVYKLKKKIILSKSLRQKIAVIHSKMRIALAQIDTVLGDKLKNLSHIESICRSAATNEAKIICFPELATTGYSAGLLGTKLWNLSEESIGGETDTLFTRLANELNLIIICGFVERGKRLGQIYNSAGVWIPGFGNCQHVHRKIHLWDKENYFFCEGNECKVIETPLCRIGVMICYDLEFPEVARSFAMDNADVVFVLSAWEWNKNDEHIWNINCAARALENTLHLVAVNRYGVDGEFKFPGGSQIISSFGKEIVRASDNGEDLVYGDIDLEFQAQTRLHLTFLKDMKTHIYEKFYAKQNQS